MRIAIISSGGYGFEYEDYSKLNLLGSEAQLLGLSRALAKKGHEVSIIRRWHDSSEDRIDTVRIVSIKSLTTTNPLLQTCSKLVFSWKSLKKLECLKPEVLVVVDPYSAFFELNQLVPKAVITHSVVPYEMIHDSQPSMGAARRLYTRVNKIFLKRLFGRCNIIIALNEDLRDYLRKRGYRAVCIPNGIEISSYPASSQDDGFVLFGGRFVKEKGIEFLLNAYSGLDSGLRKKHRLMIVGFGEEEEHLKQLAKRLEINQSVDFVPWQKSNDFTALLARSSVFVLPSLYETFGIVVIEAMALGKPVIASRIPGPKNIINHNEDGLLFDRGNTNQLRECLRLLLENENLRKSIGAKARLKAQSLFDFDVVAGQFLREFEKLIGE